MRKPKRAITTALTGIDKALAEYQSSIREYHIGLLDERGWSHEEALQWSESVVLALTTLHRLFRVLRDTT